MFYCFPPFNPSTGTISAHLHHQSHNVTRVWEAADPWIPAPSLSRQFVEGGQGGSGHAILKSKGVTAPMIDSRYDARRNVALNPSEEKNP
jgi:hypothetical protein